MTFARQNGTLRRLGGLFSCSAEAEAAARGIPLDKHGCHALK